ncbi:MAG: succinate dehydrogenase, cytochrome b556 subunit [Alphaproteobacteria bacterium]|nr:succinate dehydrogenase, cytochrome b556 subunit [Alphaproteobacteria bacterium]
MAASKQRPLSPHLQIYRPQLTSVLSIFHRLTGVALSGGTLLLAWWLVAGAIGPDAYAIFEAFCTSWIGWVLLAGFSYALMYHMCNGIRHLFWDGGFGLELKDAYVSGYVVVVASVVLTALVWGVGLGIGGEG